MNKIRISEHFYSIQGEGSTVGVPSVFLRLQGCNLNCGSKFGSWVCDTVDVWKKGLAYAIDDAYRLITDTYESCFKKGAHLVITGGEPLLQQDAIIKLLGMFDTPLFVEIETNGTVRPKEALLTRIDQWNVSPKLSNCGEALEHRRCDDVLDLFSNQENSIFKFVVCNMDDIKETISEFFWLQSLSINRKFLMPAAESKNSLHTLYPEVIDLAKKYGFTVGQRFHLSVWDQKTGI